MPQAANVVSISDYRKSAGISADLTRRAETLEEARQLMLANPPPAYQDGQPTMSFEVDLLQWQLAEYRRMRKVIGL